MFEDNNIINLKQENFIKKLEFSFFSNKTFIKLIIKSLLFLQKFTLLNIVLTKKG